MGGLLGKVVLELTVEEVFNVGTEVEIGLELKVVEDWTTEGDELVDWQKKACQTDHSTLEIQKKKRQSKPALKKQMHLKQHEIFRQDNQPRSMHTYKKYILFPKNAPESTAPHIQVEGRSTVGARSRIIEPKIMGPQDSCRILIHLGNKPTVKKWWDRVIVFQKQRRLTSTSNQNAVCWGIKPELTVNGSRDRDGTNGLHVDVA